MHNKKFASLMAGILTISMLMSACSVDKDQLKDGLNDIKDAAGVTTSAEVTEDSVATESSETTIETTVATPTPEPTATSTPTPTNTPTPTPDPYPTIKPEYVGKTATEICEMMTIEEKAAQMVQGAIYLVNDKAMEGNCYGSILGKYDPSSIVDVFNDSTWLAKIQAYQAAAIRSDSGIPFIYGQDAVHGVNFASETVLFPHNINLGAANDTALTYEIGILTGSDIMHTGMIWNFSPCVAASQDPRWGRTYESYSSDLGIVTDLAVAYSQGLMSQGVVVCAKHFFADGNVLFGTGEYSDNTYRLIDRGDAQLTDEEIAELLKVYKALIDSGVQSIMLSHSSVNGVKMHENKFYISYLKNEMGFNGVVLSDWNSLHNCSGESYEENVILCINAGCDMLMEPEQYAEARDIIVKAYNDGRISGDRIDDAVTRILRMKINAGLFDDPYMFDVEPDYDYNSEHATEVAREAAAKSFVVLKNDGPMEITEGMKVFVLGPAADDSGVLCGGWTYSWTGYSDGDLGFKWVPNCTTIIESLEEVAEEVGFEIVTDEALIGECDLVILCVGETPYAEWTGDASNLSITGDLGLEGNLEAIEAAANAVDADGNKIPTLTLIVAGRNVLISNYVDKWDSVIMCYLPGTEGGHAVADVLTGKATAGGKLPMPYYASEGQIGTDECWLPIGYSAS